MALVTASTRARCVDPTVRAVCVLDDTDADYPSIVYMCGEVRMKNSSYPE
jgi:hypothetical protein